MRSLENKYKNIVNLIVLINVLLVIGLHGQSKVDSLTNIRDSIINNHGYVNIEAMEKQILNEIITNGYETTLYSSNKSVRVTDGPGKGKFIKILRGGNKVIIIGKVNIYYKLKIDKKIGYAYFPEQYFPLTLFEDIRYKDFWKSLMPKDQNNENIKKSNSSSYGCSTTRCFGNTKKGTRCRNRTSNCSGRCYLH